MLIRYSNTFADALAFATVHNLRSIPLLTFILAISMWIGWSSLPDDGTFLVRVAAFALMTLVVFIAILVFQLLFNAYWFAFNRDKNYLTDHQAELTESAFVESTSYTRVEIKWPGIFAVRAALGRLFVFEGPSRAHCIPARAFATRADFEAFVSHAKDSWRRANGA